MEARIESTLTPIAQKIAEKRYFQKDDNGNCTEDWNDLALRVVNHVCRDEDDKYRKKIFKLIRDTKFLPNSPCLVNSGKPGPNGLLACHVSPPPQDSWDDMCRNVKTFGDIARRGGGNGMCLSAIRPEGDPVFGSTHAKACGPIQHMRVISETMSSITQAGFRGMANLASLHVSHPDIENFIICKQRDKALKSLLKEDIFQHYDQLKNRTDEQINIVLDKYLSNFNISVLVTDDFMESVVNDSDWDLVFGERIYRTIKAKELFHLIAKSAWQNGDPGLLFYNAINNGPYKFSKQEITATNPCGEEPLPATHDGKLLRGGSCNLGSIDISKFFDRDRAVDWQSLKKAIHVCVQFLDNVINVNVFPDDNFYIWAEENRPVGLGIMGWADLLLKLRIAYGSKRSLELAQEVAKFFEDEAHRISVKLAKERGTPKACQYDGLEHRRNVTLTSIAPTGSISLLAGCSSSIEPIFSPVVHRYDNTGHSQFQHSDATKNYFRCAVDVDNKDREVTAAEHIDMQSAFQKFGSSGISKTINMPQNATVSDVESAYLRAWKSGCFPKNTIVYTPDGVKNIDELQAGDHVFSDDGKPSVVEKVFHLNSEHRRFVKIQPFGILPFSCTINHPILTFKPSTDGYKLKYKYKGWEEHGKIQYIEASDISKEDYVLIPKLRYSSSNIKKIKISDYLDTPFIIQNDLIFPARPLPWKAEVITKCPKSKGIPNEIKVNDYLCEFLGWFIAEGHFARNSCIRLNFNILEEPIVKNLQKIVKLCFGLNSHTYITKGNGGVSLRLEFYSTIVSLLLKSLCGMKSRNKHLPDFFTKISQRKLTKLIDAYYKGDAGVTVSRQLAYELSLANILLKRTPISRVNSKKEYNICYKNGKSQKGCCGAKTVRFNNTSYLIYKINKLNYYESDEPVYNISIKETDSYLVNGVAAHNCKGITIYRDGSKTTQVLNTSQKAQLGTNNASRRPKTVPADIFKTTADGFDWHVIVGKVHDNPYEIFAINGRVGLPKTGQVVKRKKRHYALLDDEGNILIDNLAEEEQKIHHRISLETRRFSLELRHSIHPKYIVHQIDKSHEVITSFSKAVGRIMKNKYVDAADILSIESVCPQCSMIGKTTELINESGCVRCPDVECGYSKCG